MDNTSEELLRFDMAQPGGSSDGPAAPLLVIAFPSGRSLILVSAAPGAVRFEGATETSELHNESLVDSLTRAFHVIYLAHCSRATRIGAANTSVR